jgi:hypothetical protein
MRWPRASAWRRRSWRRAERLRRTMRKGEGAPHRAPPPPWVLTTERAYKPNSVAPARPFGRARDGRSSIWDVDCSTPRAAYPRLGRATRDGTASRRPVRLMLGLAPGGVCLAGPVTRAAGGPLHHPFTLAPAHPGRAALRQSTLCCTCRRVAPPGCYPAPCSTEFGLSSKRRAAPRPSGSLSRSMVSCGPGIVKPELPPINLFFSSWDLYMV